MATRTVANGGGNFNSTGTWVEGFVPTNADDVVFTGTSGSLTVNVNSACKSIDFTNYTGIFTLSTHTLTVDGSFKLVAGMTFSPSSGTSTILIFNGSGAGNLITTAGKLMPNMQINGPGDWTLQDSFTSIGTAGNTGIDFENGTFNANNQNIITGYLITNSAATINMGSGTWTLRNTAAPIQFGTPATINANTSTISITSLSTSSPTLDFGGTSIYNLTINAGTTANRIVSFASNVTVTNNLVIGARNTITLAAGIAVTVNNLTINSTAGTGVVTINSDTPGSKATLAGNGGSYNFSYLNIVDSAATVGTWTATNSINGGDNSGWAFPVAVQSTGDSVTATSGGPNQQSTGGACTVGGTHQQSSGGY